MALLIACSGAAVAAGSFTASDGTITACRDNRSGTLRVIQSGQSCTASRETAVTWKDGITGKVADSDKLDGQDSTAFAGFGDTAYKDAAFVSPCSSDVELVSRTFSVPRQTLVYTNATTTFNQNTTDDAGVIRVRLFDASSGDLLGTTATSQADVEDETRSHEVPLSAQGVIYSASTKTAPYSTTSTPLVLNPGNQYKLTMLGYTSGPVAECGSGSDNFAIFGALALSYLLIGKS